MMTDVAASFPSGAEAGYSDTLRTASKLASLEPLEESADNERVDISSTGDVTTGDKLAAHYVITRNNAKLEKKQSSGDLHSRLKTRKLLGVGETPDGDVHRSKLSQILGHNDQLYTRLPRGVRVWQYANAIVFTSLAAMYLLLPSYANLSTDGATIDGNEKHDVSLEASCACRLHGAALAGLSVLMWSSVHIVDKEIIRYVALASTCYWSLNCCVITLTLIQLGQLTESAISLLSLRLVALSASSYCSYVLSGRDVHRRQRAKVSKVVTQTTTSSSTVQTLFDKKSN